MPTAVPPEIAAAARAGNDALRTAIEAAGGSPLQDGNNTTFIYVGDADQVMLRTWFDVFPHPQHFQRQEGTDLWFLRVNLPERSRIEYKLVSRRGEKQSVTLDPLNPQRAHHPFGTNSVVVGPGYVEPEWTRPREGLDRGSIEPIVIHSDAFGDRRMSRLYVSAHASEDPLPLLIVHDGSEYVEYSALTTVLDNLIDSSVIPPLAAALTDPSDRNREYTADPRHADHLVHELIPAVHGRLAIDYARLAALGASLGGVASLHAAWLHPGIFSALILQSGSFVTALGGRFRRGKVFAPVVEFMRAFATHPGTLPKRVHLSCGRFDGLYADNRDLYGFLREQGVDAEYEEVPDGHNWENWRDRLEPGLRHAFGR